MSSTKIAVLVGSLRRDSHSRQIAEAAIALAPPALSFSILELGTLQFYNSDLEGNHVPAAWTAFRGQVRSADAFLFVTPEYNRSVPAVLKNALDIASRPYGQNVWAGKPAAVISQSIGALGGFGANHHLRQMLTFLDVPVLQQPEAYIGNSADLVTSDGRFASETTGPFLAKFMEKFAAWAARIRA